MNLEAWIDITYIHIYEINMKEQSEFKTCWDMYDPAIAPIYYELA
jgi:hypothetical protein